MVDKMYSFTNALSAAAVTPSLLPTETESDTEVSVGEAVLHTEAKTGALHSVVAL